MDSQSNGRIHYGRQDLRSGATGGAPSYSVDRAEQHAANYDSDSYGASEQPHSSPNYLDDSYRGQIFPPQSISEDHRAEQRHSRRSTSTSVWEESSNLRTRQAERLGTARDARRIQERHERQSHRTPNRNTVYNTGGSQEDVGMFQAVAAGDHMDHQPYRKNHSGYGGINSKGSWNSSSSTRYPALREHHRYSAARIVLPVVLVILAIVAIALGVHSCVSA